MERPVFAAMFDDAVRDALALAREAALTELPVVVRFHLDPRPSLAEQMSRMSPLAAQEAKARVERLRNTSARKVVSELWRDGRVPFWINVGVATVTPELTMIEVSHAREFVDDREMAERMPGWQPFRIRCVLR